MRALPPLPSRALRSLLSLAALTAFLYLAILTVQRAWAAYQIEQSNRELRAEIQKLRERYERVLELQAFAQSEEYIERVAREEMNLIKPGEMAVVVLSPLAPPSLAPAPSTPARPALRWQRWWERVWTAADN